MTYQIDLPPEAEPPPPQTYLELLRHHADLQPYDRDVETSLPMTVLYRNLAEDPEYYHHFVDRKDTTFFAATSPSLLRVGYRSSGFNDFHVKTTFEPDYIAMYKALRAGFGTPTAGWRFVLEARLWFHAVCESCVNRWPDHAHKTHEEHMAELRRIHQ